MKKILNAASALLLSAALFTSLQSCNKEDEGTLPNISFKSGTGYLSSDTTVKKNTTLKIGLNANKTSDKEVLTKFTITRKFQDNPDVIIYTEYLTGEEADKYFYDFNFTTGGEIGTETYKFTVINKDGLTNQVVRVINIEE